MRRSITEFHARRRTHTPARLLCGLPFLYVVFGVPRANAEGRAEDLGPPLVFSFSETHECVARERQASITARELAVAALTDACETQNQSLHAQGLPSCAPNECVSSLVFGASSEAQKVNVSVAIAPRAASFSVQFAFPLGSLTGTTPRWSARCETPFTMAVERRAQLGDIDDFFAVLLGQRQCRSLD